MLNTPIWQLAYQPATDYPLYLTKTIYELTQASGLIKFMHRAHFRRRSLAKCNGAPWDFYGYAKRRPVALPMLWSGVTPTHMSALRTAAAKRPWLTGFLAAVALAGAIALFVFLDIDWHALQHALAALDTGTVLVLTTVLPLFGLPISLVYFVIGARFGPVDGLGVVTLITVLHLLGTHLIGRGVLRKQLERVLTKTNHRTPRVPPGENTAIALMVLLAPAVPYFIRNYILALSGIPLRAYFWIALPIHVLRSYVALFIGDFGSAPSQRGVVLIVVYYVIQLGVLSAVAWWLRKRHKRLAEPHAAAGAGVV